MIRKFPSSALFLDDEKKNLPYHESPFCQMAFSCFVNLPFLHFLRLIKLPQIINHLLFSYSSPFPVRSHHPQSGGSGATSSSSSSKMAPVADAVFESQGVAETQPAVQMRMPGDGSDSSSVQMTTEAPASIAMVTGLPPSGTLKRNKQRRIEVDYSLFHDDDTFCQASTSTSSSSSRPGAGAGAAPGTTTRVTKENDQNVQNVPLRRREFFDISL